MTPAELCDIEEIKQLKARYFRFVDTKQWDKLRALFTDDVVFEGLSGENSTPDEFIANLRTQRGSARTIHHGHTPEIRIIDPSTARGIWAMFDWVEFPVPITAGPRAGQRGARGYGYYEEEYAKSGDAWRIAFLRLARLRVEPLFGPGVAYDLGPDRIPYVPNDWLERGRS